MTEKVINEQEKFLQMSEELNSLLDFTKNTLAKELPTLTIDEE